MPPQEFAGFILSAVDRTLNDYAECESIDNGVESKRRKRAPLMEKRSLELVWLSGRVGGETLPRSSQPLLADILSRNAGGFQIPGQPAKDLVQSAFPDGRSYRLVHTGNVLE